MADLKKLKNYAKRAEKTRAPKDPQAAEEEELDEEASGEEEDPDEELAARVFARVALPDGREDEEVEEYLDGYDGEEDECPPWASDPTLWTRARAAVAKLGQVDDATAVTAYVYKAFGGEFGALE